MMEALCLAVRGINKLMLNMRPTSAQNICLFATKPIITAIPSSGLIDDPVSIMVHGVQPSSRISIRSTLPERGNLFESVAHFIADEDGRVDLNKQHSVGGNYTGLEPMGLFWSLQPSRNAKQGTRYVKKEVAKPAEFTFTVYNDHLDHTSVTTSEPLASITVQKWYMMDKDVDRIKVHHGRVRGILFKPKGPGLFPGVIDIFGGAGGVIEFRAALLASRGFAALSLPYFQYEDLPETNCLEFEYFEEASDWFSSQPFVLPNGIGIIGISYGGTLALKMAAELPQIKAVVAIGCLPVFFFSITSKGKQIGYLNLIDFSNGSMNENGAVVMKDMMNFVRDTPQENVFKVENCQGQFLFIIGEDDQNVPSIDAVNVIIERLRSHGKDNYELLSYPGAGHLIEPPNKPSGREAYNVPFEIVLDFGGEAKAHAYACQDAWVKTLAFFRKYITGDNTQTNSPTVKQSATCHNLSSKSSKL